MTDIRQLELEVWGMSTWLILTDEQKAVVKFGMLPVEIAAKGEELGFTSRETALAMMKAADTIGGGMVA